MFILSVSNQRSTFYIKVDDLNNMGSVWYEISKKGYFKLNGYYKANNSELMEKLSDNDFYFDSLDSFLKR